jgi:hypothetical protein
VFPVNRFGVDLRAQCLANRAISSSIEASITLRKQIYYSNGRSATASVGDLPNLRITTGVGIPMRRCRSWRGAAMLSLMYYPGYQTPSRSQ